MSYVVVLFLLAGLSSCNFKANKEYKNAIETGDSFLTEKKYDDAKASYTKAAEIKPDETYPKEKITEIDNILTKKKEEAYKLQVKNGDDLFGNKSYNEAKAAYAKASQMKPKENYPKEKIQEIDKILAEIKKQEEYKKYPYHIIVGCFTVESNATKLNAKLLAEGKNSRIIKMRNGRFDAVTYASYQTIHESYNNLKEAQAQFGEEAWVYKHSSK